MHEISNPGTRMKELRQRLSVGQVDFSRAIGVPQSNLSPWESGKRPVPMPVLLAVCSVYGASKAWLLDGIGPMFEAELELGENRSRPPLEGIYLSQMQGILTAIRQHYHRRDRIESALAPGRDRAIQFGHDLPTFAELGVIARVLEVPITDLLVNPDGSRIEVDLQSVNPLDTIFPRKSAVIPAEALEEPEPAKPAKALIQRLTRLESIVSKLQTDVEQLVQKREGRSKPK